MLANAMVVGQVGLAVASLYCQSGRLKMVNDDRRKVGAYVDAPFLKPYKELIEEMRAELQGVGDEESITYNLRLIEILRDNGGMRGMHRFYSRSSSRPSKKQRKVEAQETTTTRSRPPLPLPAPEPRADGPPTIVASAAPSAKRQRTTLHAAAPSRAPLRRVRTLAPGAEIVCAARCTGVDNAKLASDGCAHLIYRYNSGESC